MLAPGRYDDGGFSGGNVVRPALAKLLADVKAGLVDVIIVYKIDRLTRSLTDFAKTVDVLDRAGASFVSITQSFNTTTSMGRLTLNVLLSFAQFEREVIAERVCDKVAASKAWGIWMGGGLPLGYDVYQRNPVINEPEAEKVRYIFRRYLELGTVPALRADLDRQGITTKRRLRPDGSISGGNTWWPGPLYALLKNRIYIGKIVHKDKCYEGLHRPIVEVGLFEAVQAQLARNAVHHHRREYAKHNSLLTGMTRDHLDRPLTPRHANKGTKRYCYYMTNGIPNGVGGQEPPVWRIPTSQIEAAVIAQVTDVIDKTDEWTSPDQLNASESIHIRTTEAVFGAGPD
jgi:site-specific DNA recombinase